MTEQRWKVIDYLGDDHTTDLSQAEAIELAKELEEIFNEDYSIDACFERENEERRNKEQPWRNRSFSGVDGHEDLYPDYNEEIH